MKQVAELQVQATLLEGRYLACVGDLNLAAARAIDALEEAEANSGLKDGLGEYARWAKRGIDSGLEKLNGELRAMINQATKDADTVARMLNRLLVRGGSLDERLAGFREASRGFYTPDVARNREAYFMPSDSVDEQAKKLRLLGESPDGTRILIEKKVHADGSTTYTVYIPGTEDGGSVNTWLSAAAAGGGMATPYLMGVLEAMRQAGITPTDSVQLVGHSQGGLVASNIAGLDGIENSFNIDSLVIFGGYNSARDLPGSSSDLGATRSIVFIDDDDWLSRIGGVAKGESGFPHRVSVDNTAPDNHSMKGYENLSNTSEGAAWEEEFRHHYVTDGVDYSGHYYTMGY